MREYPAKEVCVLKYVRVDNCLYPFIFYLMNLNHGKDFWLGKFSFPPRRGSCVNSRRRAKQKRKDRGRAG